MKDPNDAPTKLACKFGNCHVIAAVTTVPVVRTSTLGLSFTTYANVVINLR